ncbi:2-polyprenyl-6-methoxyphenol hydroxylase-like oxidoreductase [Mesorhizobium plurifarium]|uniref:2-polyprenyl-6-methoxyphenol hydroxylase-like oxidoreductase n=1 Tax=Mesorhizobium plurifarium TaxID=69974 RepID=A0A090G4F6_MESPL|nr:2-polyprenyl-6-methoxyphenol hydroxylase-like oxidoreductase [Mesorhizobium plurifarium]
MAERTVLISGGGIAGPALAFWLAAAGFRPTLIERAPQLRTGGYVIDFWGLGYDIASWMGLEADIDRVGYHVREMRIVGENGKRVGGFGTDVFGEVTNGRYVTLARSDLSRLLFEKINDTTEVIFDNEIVGLEENSDGVRVQLERGGERDYSLVVGADGLHSDVRRLAFGPQLQFEKKLGYAVAAFEAEGYRPRDEDVYLMYGLPGRMLGRFTLHGNRTLFLFVFTVGESPLPTALDLQKEMLRNKYADGGWECPRILEELGHTDELYFDSVSQIAMNRWAKGRVVLTGDAAFCVSLLAGQGSALAMISAYVLAGELLKADGRHEEAFGSYEALLRNYIRTKQQGAARFASALAPRTRLGLLFRNLVTNAFIIPGLARLVIGKEITDALHLPDYRWR